MNIHNYIKRDFKCKNDPLSFSSSSYLLFVLVFFVLSVTFPSCTLEDSRDACCESTVLTYRYVRSYEDEFPFHIRTIRHHLFDSSGRYVAELRHKPETRGVRIGGIPYGRYTVLTLCNVSSETEKLSSPSDGLSGLVLESLSHSGISGNVSRLYWNKQEVEYAPGHRCRYVCDLSNIHCRLSVKVRWKEKPPMDIDGCELELDEAVVSDSLSSFYHRVLPIRQSVSSCDADVTHKFPSPMPESGTHRVRCHKYGMELYGDFVTLRYTNDRIPVLRLLRNGEYLTKPIPLSKAFKSWGWHPDDSPEQVYRIEMEIHPDGKVVLNQWYETSVRDWENGGVVGVSAPGRR